MHHLGLQLKRSEEGTTLLCFWKWESFKFLPIGYDVGYRFLGGVLYQVEDVPLYSRFLRIFIVKRCWILWIASASSIDMIIPFFFFSLLISQIMLIDFQMLNQPCILGTNLSWPWLDNYFYISLSSISKYFAEDFCIFVHERSCSVVLGYAALTEWVRKYPFCFSFLEEIIENLYNFFLKWLVVDFTCVSISAWYFHFWMFIIY